jgi:hypothetical protein
MMTYYESAEGIEIDKARVILELKRHGCSEEEIQECFEVIGPGPMWDAQDVLRWLHY